MKRLNGFPHGKPWVTWLKPGVVDFSDGACVAAARLSTTSRSIERSLQSAK
jgi:hypothetical protein